jgi:hypothetical protein
VGDGGVRIRGGRTQESAIEHVEFSDGTLWSGADLQARAQVLPDNRAPEMPALLGRVTVDPGSPVEIAITREAISDPDRFDSLGFYAISADGEPLPDWLHFDPSSLTVSGTPAAADAGPHELLLIAVDSNGAAAYGSLAISVGGVETAPQDETAPQPAVSPILQPAMRPSPPTEAVAAIDVSATQIVPAPARREEAVFEAAPVVLPIGDSPNVGDSAEPVFRDIQHRFDALLQTGRTNLGERYAEAVREFEERRLQREETSPAPQSDDEVEAWNSAMHNWHERNPGFAETDLGGNDGTWTMGWGLPGTGERSLDGAVGGSPGLTNPGALPQLRGAGAAPSLGEGLKDLR